MKKYCFLTTNSEPKIVGVRHGCGEARLFPKEEFDFKTLPWINIYTDNSEIKPDLYNNHINKYEGIVEYQLEKRAKLNDFLSTTGYFYGCEFLVSLRLKLIFEEYKLPHVQFKKVQINDENGLKTNHEYYMMQMPFLEDDDVDWQKTFFLDMLDFIKFREPERKDYCLYFLNSFKEDSNKLIPFKCLNVALKSNVDSDLIFTKFSNVICSEELKMRLIKEKITNCIFIDFKYEDVEVKHISFRK